MSIQFTKRVEEARFHSPLADFDLDTVPVEYREDPLTGQYSRVVEEWFPNIEDEPDVADYVGDGAGCFFCPDNVADATPTYPEFVGFDRGSVDEATSFPNLFPYAKHSNVVVLTEDHFRPIGALTADLFTDGFACALAYLRAVSDHDDASFASVNMNLLPSAGSSVVHPHLQALTDDIGTNESRRVRQREREYHAEHGRSYWDDLANEERGGPRHVGSTGDVTWLVPFAPRHQYHVTGITDCAGIPEPTADVVSDLAAGVESVLAYYADLGLNAFNFALRLGDGDPASRAVFDIVAHPSTAITTQTTSTFRSSTTAGSSTKRPRRTGRRSSTGFESRACGAQRSDSTGISTAPSSVESVPSKAAARSCSASSTLRLFAFQKASKRVPTYGIDPPT